MIGKYPPSDRILVAQLTGEARHHAKWRDLSEAEEAAAVDALRELASGRADLLAQVTGLLEGYAEGELGAPINHQAAGLCRKAGADPDAIPAWIEEGRRRREAARQPPFSGGVHGGGARPGSLRQACRGAFAPPDPDRGIFRGGQRGRRFCGTRAYYRDCSEMASADAVLQRAVW
jgi:hypothetical protein